jgi:hypothetical protein
MKDDPSHYTDEEDYEVDEKAESILDKISKERFEKRWQTKTT